METETVQSLCAHWAYCCEDGGCFGIFDFLFSRLNYFNDSIVDLGWGIFDDDFFIMSFSSAEVEFFF